MGLEHKFELGVHHHVHLILQEHVFAQMVLQGLCSMQ